MPYPFAHPAAVLPLVPLLGRLAVAPALVIGSMVPDAWYLVPGMVRADSHSATGLLWFCLPVGLLAYLAYRYLRTSSLPDKPWHAVVVSLLAGALTHLAWDGLTHSYEVDGFYVLQHASTVLGTAVVVWWWTRSFRLGAAAGALLAAGGAALLALSPDIAALRGVLREAAVAAAWLAAAAFLAWRLISARATAPRARQAPSRRTPGR
jgi:hypothetical protein